MEPSCSPNKIPPWDRRRLGEIISKQHTPPPKSLHPSCRSPVTKPSLRQPATSQPASQPFRIMVCSALATVALRQPKPSTQTFHQGRLCHRLKQALTTMRDELPPLRKAVQVFYINYLHTQNNRLSKEFQKGVFLMFCKTDFPQC